jgi:prepilin-type N-terminal cleavage/methylation domain-containing protein
MKVKIFKSQKGIALLEVLISVVILGILAAGISSALAAASKVLLQTDARETAKNMAETQMEYIKNKPYDPEPTPTYAPAPVSSGLQGRYTPTVAVAQVTVGSIVRDNIQKITVTIRGPGITYILEDYKIQQ